MSALAIATVASPAIFSDGNFGLDYSNHLWLLGYQGQAIAHTGVPTLFVHSDTLFEPYFAFYGGTLYAIGGYLSAAFASNPFVAYDLMIVLGLAMACGGMWWLARLMGLSGWVAHAPGVVAVTSPYLLADLYARGDWPEFMAISSLPLVAAGIVSHLISQTWRAGPFAVFVFGTIIASGSHNITLLLATIILSALAGAVLAGFHRSVRWSRLPQVAAVLFVGISVNSWFLLIDVSFASKTLMSNRPGPSLADMFNTLDAILNPFRTTPTGSNTHGLTVAAPVFALGWAIAVGLLNWYRSDDASRRLWSILLSFIVLIVGLTMFPGFWHSVGYPLNRIQFPLRLNGYVLYLCAALLAATLRMSRSGAALGSLVAVLILSIGPAAWQVWNTAGQRMTIHVSQTFDRGYRAKPLTWYDPNSFADASQSAVVPAPTRRVTLAAPAPGTSRVMLRVVIPAGRGPVAVNVDGAPYLTTITGVKRIGRTEAGHVVVASPDSTHEQAVDLSVVKAHNQILMFAPLISIASLAIGFSWWLWLLVRVRRGDKWEHLVSRRKDAAE